MKIKREKLCEKQEFCLKTVKFNASNAIAVISDIDKHEIQVDKYVSLSSKDTFFKCEFQELRGKKQYIKGYNSSFSGLRRLDSSYCYL